MTTDKEDNVFHDRVKARFNEWDKDHDGRLSVSEVEAALNEDVPVSRKQAESIHKLMLDGSSKKDVELEDFTRAATKRRKALLKAFHSIRGAQSTQVGKEPCFTGENLRQAAAKAGVPLSDRDWRDFMEHVDLNHDGYVTLEEFENCALLTPHINPYSFMDHWFAEAFDASTSDFSFCREVPRREGEDLRDMVIRKISCGGAAGVLSSTLTAPMDRIRLLMMTNGTRLSIASAYHKAVSHASGFRALWMGNGVSCVKIAPEMGIKLYCFDHFKSIIATDKENVTATERFMAGGCAGALAEFSVYPLDVLRTRLATGMYSGVRDCAVSTWQTGGAKAFLAGLSPSIAGIIPYASIDLGMNSLLKEELLGRDQAENVPLLLACGMVSSATAAVLTFPIVVVRTQAQATGLSIGNVVRGLLKEGGRGFYRGIVPSLMKVVPATSISYTAYDLLNARWK